MTLVDKANVGKIAGWGTPQEIPPLPYGSSQGLQGDKPPSDFETRRKGSPAGREAERSPLLSVHDVVKTFGPVRAVDGVSLDFYPQEVVGIVGDNGAGKSTFLSLLTGFHHPDSGRFVYRGREIHVRSPRTARTDLKIEMIYQRLELAPDLKVWENLFLGEELRRIRRLVGARRECELARPRCCGS